MVFPFIILFSIGIFEFGNVLWQRHQLQTGVRDAARYMARCNAGFVGFTCEDVARNIAFYASPKASEGGLRVPGWKDAAELAIEITPSGCDTLDPPPDNCVVIVRGEVVYLNSPLFDLLSIDPITIKYDHMQRFIEW